MKSEVGSEVGSDPVTSAPSASSVREKRQSYRFPRAITPHNERADMILSTLRNEPIASTLPNEPIDPIDMNEFLHPIHKMELVEAMLHLDEFTDLDMKNILLYAIGGCIYTTNHTAVISKLS